MLKILIICKSFSTSKKITNKILCNINELQISGIANNLIEAKELLEKTETDFIITTISNIVELLEENLVSNIPRIILISKSTNVSFSDSRKLLELSYNLNFQEMSKHILTFIRTDLNDSKKEQATEILSKLGFDFKLSGTLYLLDSILYANKCKGSYSFEKLKRDIYSHVAKQNNTDVNIIKWSIARSINYMCQKHTEETYEIIEKYFGIKYPKKPTPKLVINLIANILD